MNTEIMSMASLRVANKRGHLSDGDLRRIEDEREQEQYKIRQSEKGNLHPNRYELSRPFVYDGRW